MRNNRIRLLVLMLFWGIVPSWAQNPVFDHPLSTQTLPDFDAVCAQLESRPYTTGVFEQTRTVKRQNRSLVSGGDFIAAADMGLVWITKSPVPSITTLGRDYMIQSVPGGTETRIDAKGSDIYINMADTISSLFTGNAARLKSSFEIYYTKTQTANGKAWTIGLIPKETAFRNYAQRIVIEGFDGGQVSIIQSIVIEEKNGDSLIYVFSRQTFPEALEDNEKKYFSAR